MLAYLSLRASLRRESFLYLGARVLEALALGAGVLLLSAGHPEGNAQLLRLGMVALGLGSVPFFRVLPLEGWAPRWLAWSGVAGYGILIGGALLDFVVEGALLAASVPGGLFEVAFAAHLLHRGFAPRPNSL